MKKLIIALTLIFSISILNITYVNADENVVAKIGDNEYTTLDDAASAAVTGDTIVLLGDDTLTFSKIISKDITFTGTGKITVSKQTVNCYSGHTLTLDGSGVELDWVNTNGGWLALCLNNSTVNVLNGAKLHFEVDSAISGTGVVAIYMGDAGNVNLNIDNGSTFEVYGYHTAGNVGDAIQMAGTNNHINVTNNSTFFVDGTNRGYAGSGVNVYVSDSTITIQNCTSNGSNGGIFESYNSTLNYNNNKGHGLSTTTKTILQNTILNANNNSYFGFTANGSVYIDGNTTITTNYNGTGYLGGGIRFTGSSTNVTVDAGAVITSNYNAKHGLINSSATTNIQEGVVLEIMNNYTTASDGNNYESNGGGIYNTGYLSLPSNATIYNNHANATDTSVGDDIYSTGTIILGSVGTNWYLDGATDQLDCLNENGEYTNDLINGWYEDGIDTDADGNILRWQAHASTTDGNHIYLYSAGTYTGTYAIKAAHNLTGKVIATYVDEDGNELADPETSTGYVGDEYTTQEKDIENYELIKVTGEQTGTYTEDTIDVIYIYRHLTGEVISKYVDMDGNELADSETSTGYVGDEYTTQEKDIENYVLLKIVGNENGVYENGTIIVTYIYVNTNGTGGDYNEEEDDNSTEVTPPKTGINISNNNSKYRLFSLYSILFIIIIFRKFNIFE